MLEVDFKYINKKGWSMFSANVNRLKLREKTEDCPKV